MMLKFTASTLAALSLTAFNPVNAEAGCQPNLGYGFSEAMHDPSLGNTHWGIDDKKCFPPVHSLGSGESGTDDSIALLVGGNFLGSKGAEIEGNIVVMGDFHNTQSGPLNLVSAGEGSQITPSKNGDCLIVGGDMSSAKRMEIYYPHYQCRAVAKGEAKNSGRIAPQWMTGMGFRYESQPDLDLTKYEEQINDLRSKSLYWSSFPDTNGASTNISNDSFNFVCSDEDAIQVFNVDADLLQGSGYSQYVFSKSCNNKTILINVQGSGSVTFATKHTKWTNEDDIVQDGGWANFPSCMNSNILWNFPNVIDLTVKGYDEVQGSLLVNGNMSFETSGQSGRTMVLGDFTMNSFGSELHSFSFDPVIPLPDPNCETIEEGTEGEPSCSCGVNDPDSATFKCGKDIFICPGVDKICSVSPATGSQYFDLTQEQCEAMRSVEIGEKCVELPQHGIVGTGGPNGPKGLSHRDCYNSEFPDGAKEDGSCDVCKDSFPYTPSPTDAPTNALTTAPPTDSPTKMTCGEKTVSDVCIAIDNSGSVCTSPGLSATLCDSCNNKCRAGGKLDDGLCCGNYGSITDFASSYVDRLPSESNFSVLKFGSDSNVISQAGSSAEDAKNAITTSRYTGGYTFTEGAIMDCVEQLKDSANPLIVVITDGTPTVCNKSNGGKAYTGKNGCNEKRCSSCSGGSFGAAAEQAADVASENGMSLIPVIISTVSTDVEQLEDLARCPTNSETCDVNNYKGLSVDNLDELDTILDDLVIVSECAGEATNAPTSASPTSSPTDAPTNEPTMSPSLSPSESTPSPTKSPTAEPTPSPTMSPTAEPTNEPTSSPSSSPSKATLSPTMSPTLEPTNNPTSSPSSSPSKATLSPTMSPTLEPTLAPSVEAVETTLEPTVATTTKAPIATAGEDDDDDTIFTPPSTCPEDVKVIRTDGVTPFPESPSDVVRIVQQDASTVTVGLHQHWTSKGDSTALSSIFYEYRENMFSSKCYEERDVEGGQLFDTITITCNVLQPRASLEICVVDDEILDPNDNGTVPKCCHEDKEEEGLESRTVCYTLDIQCKTACVDDENDVVPARMLRGSSLN